MFVGPKGFIVRVVATKYLIGMSRYSGNRKEAPAAVRIMAMYSYLQHLTDGFQIVKLQKA
jgi:hypothetical protein